MERYASVERGTSLAQDTLDAALSWDSHLSNWILRAGFEMVPRWSERETRGITPYTGIVRLV